MGKIQVRTGFCPSYRIFTHVVWPHAVKEIFLPLPYIFKHLSVFLPLPYIFKHLSDPYRKIHFFGLLLAGMYIV